MTNLKPFSHLVDFITSFAFKILSFMNYNVLFIQEIQLRIALSFH